MCWWISAIAYSFSLIMVHQLSIIGYVVEFVGFNTLVCYNDGDFLSLSENVDCGPSPEAVLVGKLMSIAMFSRDCYSRSAWLEIGRCLHICMGKKISGLRKTVSECPGDGLFIIFANLKIVFTEGNDVRIMLLEICNGISHVMIYGSMRYSIEILENNSCCFSWFFVWCSDECIM